MPAVLKILIIVGSLGGFGALIFALFATKSAKNPEVIAKKRKHNPFAYILYRAFTKTPVINRYFNKFLMRLRSLYPADIMDVSRKATAMMAKSLFFSALVLGSVFLLGKGDIFYMCVGLLTVYVVFTNSISSGVSKLELVILKQFGDFLTTCRANYYQSGMVDEAIYDTLDEIDKIGYEIGLHINMIYEILIGTDTETEVENYTDIAPNRFLNMFAAVCATVKEYGDKRLENGESLFLKNLEYIKQEVYVEINKMETNKYLFSGMVFTVVIPTFFIKIIAIWGSMMPELIPFYEGAMGMAMMVIIFVSSFVCYEIVLNLRDGNDGTVKEHPVLENIAKLPVIAPFLSRYVNRNYTRCMRYSDNQKMIGDRISAQAFFAQRVLLGVGAAVVSLFLIIAIHISNKNAILTNLADEFQNTIVSSEEYRENLRAAAKNYINAKQIMGVNANDTEALAYYLQVTEKYDPDTAYEVATVIQKRKADYKNAYFKWYNILIAIGAFFAGFFGPLVFLWWRTKVAKTSMDDEVAQYQSIALILMNVDGMTLDVVLEWIERFSFCFKTTISECIMNLESSEREALLLMKERETHPSFLRFVDDLLNIDEVGVASAFDEVKTEQENYKEQRKLKNEIDMKERSTIARIVSFIPIGATIGLYIMLPFMMLSADMMKSFNTLTQ